MLNTNNYCGVRVFAQYVVQYKFRDHKLVSVSGYYSVQAIIFSHFSYYIIRIIQPCKKVDVIIFIINFFKVKPGK